MRKSFFTTVNFTGFLRTSVAQAIQLLNKLFAYGAEVANIGLDVGVEIFGIKTRKACVM